jgi:DNA invertase Pin-like site-specific DNA recombinase
MATARGYVRVSSEGQAESGLGIEAQRAAIQATASRLALDLAAIHEDAGLSGALALEDRPGLLAAVDELRKGDVLLVAKRDRLGRDVVGVALIERLVARKGARIVSAAGEGTEQDGPTGELMRTIIDAFAQYERALIRARTRAALRAKRARGEMTGSAPFGYRPAHDGRTLLPVPCELEVLAFVRARRDSGVSLRDIAAELNARNIPAKKGGAWVHTAVRSVLATAARHSA